MRVVASVAPVAIALAAPVAMVVAGCGGDSVICTVRADPLKCWPDPMHIPQGSVALGTGREAFEDMPDVLALEYGTQNGYDVAANVRMTGFDPGNPQNLLDPGNPRTRIRAFFADTNVPLNFEAGCPFRTAYMPSHAGNYDYELPSGVPVVFEVCWRSDRLIGKRIRIELEVMDDCGGYASDVKTVTLAPPAGYYPMETDTPGCMHAADP